MTGKKPFLVTAKLYESLTRSHVQNLIGQCHVIQLAKEHLTEEQLQQFITSISASELSGTIQKEA